MAVHLNRLFVLRENEGRFELSESECGGWFVGAGSGLTTSSPTDAYPLHQ